MIKHIGTAALAACLAATASTTIVAQEPGSAPAMTARDLITTPRLGGPTTTKAGTFTVYAVTTTNEDTLERSTDLYLRSLTDLDAKPVKLDLRGSAFAAAFGADDFLYFLSDRPAEGSDDDSGSVQVWRAALEADGNVTGPMQVTNLGTDIVGFKLSPTGENIAVWAEIARECPRFGCDGDGQAHLPGPGNGRLYDAIEGFVRHWDKWETSGTFSRVFVFGLEDGVAVGDGEALDGPASSEGALTGDTPTKPFGGGEDVAWAADGSSVYFVARRSDANEPTSTNLDIYRAGLAGAAPVNITAGNAATDTSPAPSPDGKFLAWLAMERPGYESDKLTIMLRDLASGDTRALTQGFDRSFHSLSWTPDSKWIVAAAQDVLDTPAFRIDPTSGAIEKLDLMAGNEAHLGNIQPLSGGRLLFTRDSIGAPPELFLSKNWKQAKPISQAASRQVGGLASIVTTRFNFEGAQGDTVWGQITKLEGKEGPMPAILYIHGGPQGSFNDGWSSRWNPRVLASQGYAVISVDFHGSTGYGQAFTDSINRDWGGKPLEDLHKGLAAALAQDSQIDGSRACAMGASYGGYMVNWIAGRWPDRFKCLVQHDGLFDMRSFYYTTEELWFPRWDFGGSYAEARDEYERWNPVNHVDQWKTPMLVITGEKDFRVPYTQGIASFTALQERGIPAKLLVFPEENHWVLGAKNSLQWHETVFAWLDRWLGDDAE
ncbi:dipeptidyl-peptidase 5 [Parerythrobacter jejuensis]|uniref:Prolyl oligopeptidase family serine peptidase n=1 Tax=Parerythrobacter jejuensis TaxID=795812 RepID=A0A845AMX3_9SPHN|nr:S9 family peptidase [Parerythrobacter jejuensis]MXP30964.1 prolyl oligopeptidase family serine peptidase [Parerythrobacter jejuensis]MXP33724.1 prolyl oligopeptidase family serine peptidase [Parerythrobacter jejuensis]